MSVPSSNGLKKHYASVIVPKHKKIAAESSNIMVPMLNYVAVCSLALWELTIQVAALREVLQEKNNAEPKPR